MHFKNLKLLSTFLISISKKKNKSKNKNQTHDAAAEHLTFKISLIYSWILTKLRLGNTGVYRTSGPFECCTSWGDGHISLSRLNNGYLKRSPEILSAIESTIGKMHSKVVFKLHRFFLCIYCKIIYGKKSASEKARNHSLQAEKRVIAIQKPARRPQFTLGRKTLIISETCSLH